MLEVWINQKIRIRIKKKKKKKNEGSYFTNNNNNNKSRVALQKTNKQIQNKKQTRKTRCFVSCCLESTDLQTLNFPDNWVKSLCHQRKKKGKESFVNSCIILTLILTSRSQVESMHIVCCFYFLISWDPGQLTALKEKSKDQTYSKHIIVPGVL